MLRKRREIKSSSSINTSRWALGQVGMPARFVRSPLTLETPRLRQVYRFRKGGHGDETGRSTTQVALRCPNRIASFLAIQKVDRFRISTPSRNRGPKVDTFFDLPRATPTTALQKSTKRPANVSSHQEERKSLTSRKIHLQIALTMNATGKSTRHFVPKIHHRWRHNDDSSLRILLDIQVRIQANKLFKRIVCSHRQWQYARCFIRRLFFIDSHSGHGRMLQ